MSFFHGQVPLLPHQKRAVASLIWRETQMPCGGILGNSRHNTCLFLTVFLGL